MLNFIRLHLHPLGGRVIFWNIILLILVKVVLPNSVFQSATILENIALFDSREIITATNDARSQNGLPPLKSNFKLDNAASEKLNDMLKNGYFAHISPTGVTPWFWIKQSQYPYSIAGENLAVGFFNADDTVRAWMDSPSHKANLLNSEYQEIGIAVGKGTVRGIEGIVIVQMFGRPAISSAQPAKSISTSQPSSIAQISDSSKNIPAVAPEFEVAGQQISTNIEIPSVQQPTVIKYERAEQVSQLIKTTNVVFAIYSFGFALLSLIAFFMHGKHHHLALKTAIHAGIFLSSVAITTAEMHFNAAIF